MSKSGVGPFFSGCWRCERTWPCPGKMLSPVQPLDLCTLRVLRQQTVSPFLQTRTLSPREISQLARGAPSQRPVCPEGRVMRLETCARQVLRAGGLALSGLGKCLSRSPSVPCAEPGGERWEQETVMEPPGADVKGLQDGRNDLLFSSPEWYSRGGCCYFWGCSCCWWGHSSTRTTTAAASPSSCILTNDICKTPNSKQDHVLKFQVGVNLWGGHDLSQYTWVAGVSGIGPCRAWSHVAGVVPYCGQAQHLLSHLHPFLQCQRVHCAVYVVSQVQQEWGGTGARGQRGLSLASESWGWSLQCLS